LGSLLHGEKKYGGFFMKRMIVTFLVSFIICVGGSTLAASPKIIDFEIEVELKNNRKYDIEYELKAPDKIEAKVSVPGSVTLHGKNAIEKIEPLLKKLNLTPVSDQQKLKATLLSMLKINKKDILDFELEVKFDTGEKIKIGN
jgi:hypothetical protein